MSKQYKSCGSYVPNDANFCQVCGGSDFVSESNQTPNQPTFDQTWQSPVPQNQPKKKTYSPENPLPPSGYPVSRKDFIEKYAEPSLKKNITSIAILCYVCAGVTFVASCLSNPWGIIDAVVLAAFALGMHLAKSKACAILILILSIVEVLLSLPAGSFPFWWLFAGISAAVVFAKIEKQYREFLQSNDAGRRRPPNQQ